MAADVVPGGDDRGGCAWVCAPLTNLVLVAAGQSNMVGYGADSVPFGAGTPYTNAHLTQLGRFNGNNFVLVPAVDPLDYAVLGPGHSQAITAAYNTWLYSGFDVTIIPCAQGSTGFGGAVSWTPVSMSTPNTQSLYYDCTNRTNFVLSMPGYELAGILWDQGETESAGSVPASTWLADVENLVSSWRRDLIGAATVPFVAVQMVPSYVAANANGTTYAQIQAAIDSIPSNIAYSAAVYGLDASGNSLPSGDGGPIHYSAHSAQALGFADYFALQAARQNYAGSTTPGRIVQVFVSGSTVSWTPDPVAASYQVRVNTSVSYTTQPTLALGQLAMCASYPITVTGVGSTGQLGAPSATALLGTVCYNTAVTVYSSLPSPNLVLDWESNTIPTSQLGSTIATWPDATPNGNNAVQPSAAYEPTLLASNSQYIPWLQFSFSGSSFMQAPAVFPVSSDYTIVAMIQVSPSGATTPNILSGTSRAFFIYNGFLSVEHGGLLTNAGNTVLVPVGVPVVVAFAWVNSAGTGTYYLNATTAGSAGGGANTDNTICLAVLNCMPSGQSFPGYMFAVLVYNATLSSSDMAHVNGVLWDKYTLGHVPSS